MKKKFQLLCCGVILFALTIHVTNPFIVSAASSDNEEVTKIE